MRALRLSYVALLLAFAAAVASADGAHVSVITVHGAITPPIASYVERGVDMAERENARALVIQIDTPGGLDDSMRKIMQRIIASSVPVVVYVSPAGGRAASAGMFIVEAAHVAAMAPDTNIGSAHPVQLGGGAAGGTSPPDKTMTEKVENDAVALVRSIATTRGRNVEWVEQAVRQSVNVPAREALDLKVVDLVAPDLPSLLAQIDGREVTLGDGRRVRLETRGVEIRAEEMTLAERLIHTISDPNIAYLLLTIGMYGLIYELANPGSWVPGTIGIVMLVLAFYALGTLETNWAGVALIGLAFVLFVADVVVTSGHGALTAAGLATLVLGSLFLFAGSRGDLQLSPWVIGGVALGTGGFFLFALRAVYRARHLPASVGGEALVGEIGTVMSDLAPIGTIEIVGELWRAEPAESDMVPIGQGQRVRVVARHGLTLRVHPLA